MTTSQIRDNDTRPVATRKQQDFKRDNIDNYDYTPIPHFITYREKLSFITDLSHFLLKQLYQGKPLGLRFRLMLHIIHAYMCLTHTTKERTAIRDATKTTQLQPTTSDS